MIMLHIASLIFALLVSWSAWAQVPLTGAGNGIPGITFQGPADIVAAPFACISLRACSLALATTKVANICNLGDVNCADVKTLINGDFDVATAQGSPLNCGGAGGTCTIKTWYDQIGTGCAGSAQCSVTNATVANRPTLVFNCFGTKPCAQFTLALSQTLQGIASASTVIPQTVSFVAERSGNFTNNQYVLQSGGSYQFGWKNVANTFNVYTGGANAIQPTVAASDGAVHSVQAIVNGASSNLNIDGVDNTGTTLGTSTLGPITVGGGTGTFVNGPVGEIIVYSNLAFTSGNNSAMCHNQRMYWGTVGSC